MQLDEKKAIEKATAGGFLKLYNQDMDTSYRIAEHSDSPDIRCEDTIGNRMNLEITLTEDQPGDIQALLGRSGHRSVEAWQAFRAEVDAGRASVFERVSTSGSISQMLVSGIQAKLKKDYGPNTALVVRVMCPADPDLYLVLDDIKARLDLSRNPFDKGIWILWRRKDRLFRLV